MNLLILIALLCTIGAGFYSSNPWLVIPPLIALFGWVLIGGA
jgi:hypothetical protein